MPFQDDVGLDGADEALRVGSSEGGVADTVAGGLLGDEVAVAAGREADDLEAIRVGATTSRAWVPIEPVLPRTMMRRFVVAAVVGTGQPLARMSTTNTRVAFAGMPDPSRGFAP